MPVCVWWTPQLDLRLARQMLDALFLHLCFAKKSALVFQQKCSLLIASDGEPVLVGFTVGSMPRNSPSWVCPGAYCFTYWCCYATAWWTAVKGMAQLWYLLL